MADKIEIKTEKKLKSKKYNYDEKKERERMLVIIINIFIFGDIEFLKSILLKEKDVNILQRNLDKIVVDFITGEKSKI